MEKKVLFFTDAPPEDKTAIHIWVGKTTSSHEQHIREILERYLGSSTFKLESLPGGKLFLPNESLHFNLSDSQEWVAMALSWEAPVGIDIETIRPFEGMEQLICDCFSLQEQAYVNNPHETKKLLVRFWEIWNRKEACFKALGLGLQDNISHWDCYGNDWILVNQVWVRSVPMEHPLSLAVAIRESI
ncbi:MAG: 4'-phosphopantetheinyl transferase superfamily protein [Parachlamydiales bacterium]|nr:4'-phosphopantetheinyl transferase superfamily protein [Candidatus Acheromyda pituitae]